MIDNNKLLCSYKNTILEVASLVAFAVIAVQGKKEDDISERKAFKLFGSDWVKSRTKIGALHYTRSGSSVQSTKIYSRLEIEATRLAEKGINYQVKYGQKTAEEYMSRLADIMNINQ